MRFSTASVVALAAGASAAVVPRTVDGYWNVQVTVSPDHSIYVVAPFRSEAYPDGLRNACVDNPFADPPVPKRCDHLEFTYSYDGQTMNVTQTIELPTKQTLFGSAYLPWTQDLGDGRIRGEAIIPVQKAIA